MASLGPLVSTEWLGQLLHDDDIKIIDCRFSLAEPDSGHTEYLAGHIPGASYLSLDKHLTGSSGPGRHPLPTPAEFADTLRRLGVDDGHTVVAYDHNDASIAARLWWMLRSLGRSSTVVLNGGWDTWVSEKRSTTTEVPKINKTDLTLPAQWSGTMDRAEIADTEDPLLIVDSREAARYRGEVEPFDEIAGHIPGSLNIPYQANTDDRGRFLDATSLRERFAPVEEADQVVVYCGSGITACNNILAMEIAGIDNPTLYPGSWSDWITDPPTPRATTWSVPPLRGGKVPPPQAGVGGSDRVPNQK